jgi:hypothetical protein
MLRTAPSSPQLVADTNMAHDNREKITACRQAADKAKKDERCAIAVRVPMIWL